MKATSKFARVVVGASNKNCNVTKTVFACKSQTYASERVPVDARFNRNAKCGQFTTIEIKNTTILIRTPQLEVDDEIWVFSLFDQPIAYIIELSADDFSQKEVRQPGCPNETLKLSRPHRLFEHKSKHCETEEDTDDLVCKIKSRSSLFHVTNEMAGKPITVEHQIENSYGEPGILDWLLGTSRKESV